jgi:type IV pilus assembly protein PilY1
MMFQLSPSFRLRLRALALGVAAAACVASSLAQKIDDVPPAVQNNVAPNFMFMIDNSGSMSNIVPAAPYSSTLALGSCTGTVITAGTSVDLRIIGSVPRIYFGSAYYRHGTMPAISSLPARCFSNTATYSARLLADTGSGTSGDPRRPGNYLDAEYTGHFLNWYFGNHDLPAAAPAAWTNRKPVASGAVETRMEIARRSAKSAMDALPLPPTGSTQAVVRVGLSTYRDSSDGGRLVNGLADLTAAWRTTLKGSIDGLTPTGSTPLATTFADIAGYIATGYAGNVTHANGSGSVGNVLRINGADNSSRAACLEGATCSSTAPRPVQQWCQRTSLFAVTDGRPQNDRGFNNNTTIRDYDRDCTGINASNCVANATTTGYDRKLARTYESEGSDYMDDIAKLMFDVDWRPDLAKPDPIPPATRAKNNITTYMIGFADPAVQNDPLLVATAAAGKGRFIAATDGPSLTAAFRSVMSDALAKDAAAAAVAVTNAQITAGSIGYASSYNSGSWYGDLEAYSLDLTTGLQNGDVQWSARDKLDAQVANTAVATARRIATFDGTAGAAFTSANGDTFRATTPTLTDAVIDYTRGDRTGEGTTVRARNYLLGDIINAEPVVVNYPGNLPIVFQAANDGMLHVIDGRVNAAAATRGQELWAYVPRLVHGKLAGRASMLFRHEYIVDGTPAVAQVASTGTVQRVLVGGLGKGGAGYYALNVTTGTAADEAAAAAKVLWEFKPANMGYSFGTPLIVNTAAGWRVVVASGLRNDTAAGGLGGDGRGRVWLLNPATGAIEKEFVTPTGFGSDTAALGLAHLGAPSVGGASTVRHVYGGDLLGNVWRVDLDAATGSELRRIAAVTTGGGAAQPITVAPVVSAVTTMPTKNFVYFGTGQYYSVDDVPGTATPNTHATQAQTIYGIVDDTAVAAPTLPDIRGGNGATCPAGGGTADFVCQTASQASASAPYRVTSHALDLSTRRGFYVDIPISGGRVNTQAALTSGGTLVVVVNKPSNVLCNPGGSSYFFQLSALTGGAIVRTFGGTDYFDAGFALADALSSRPLVVITSDGPRAIFRLSDKSTQSRQINETAGTTPLFRRIYMRPLN